MSDAVVQGSAGMRAADAIARDGRSPCGLRG